jgi:predicted nucleic acid-binding protein
MNVHFADAYYYLALFNRRDANHRRVRERTAALDGRIVTTEYVLTEVGDALAASKLRREFVPAFRKLACDPDVEIVSGSAELFARGVTLYEARADKTWSLTDCISFVVMQERGMREALTGDHHFEQAGFVALLR